MSYQAMNWALAVRCGHPGGKAILLALANYADEGGSCYPSIARLAHDAEMADRSVQRWLSRFIEAGIVHRETGAGVRTKHGNTNRYFLNLAAKSDACSAAVAGGPPLAFLPARCGGRGDTMSPRQAANGVTNDAQGVTSNVTRTPVRKPEKGARTRPTVQDMDPSTPALVGLSAFSKTWWGWLWARAVKNPKAASRSAHLAVTRKTGVTLAEHGVEHDAALIAAAALRFVKNPEDDAHAVAWFRVLSRAGIDFDAGPHGRAFAFVPVADPAVGLDGFAETAGLIEAASANQSGVETRADTGSAP